MNVRCILVTTALTISTAHRVRAQELATTQDTLSSAIGAATRERLGDPLLGGDAYARRYGTRANGVEGLEVQLRAFEPLSDESVGLGFRYDFAKRLSGTSSGDDSFDFVASGNVAFDRDSNPDDYLWTALRARWFGTESLSPSTGSRVDAADGVPDPGDEQLRALDPERFGALQRRAESGASTADLRGRREFRELARRYSATVERTLPSEFLWSSELHVGLESNQDFTSRQNVFGASLGGRLVSWNPDTTLSRFDVFDLPAATLRWLSGRDESLRLSGTAYPTIVLGIDAVDAGSDDVRDALTDDDSFFRARVEAELASPAFRVDDEELFLSVRWRLFQEIDPSSVVRDADTDESSYVEIGLELPHGFALTYSAGRLPLDANDDSTIAIGFDVQF